MIRINDVIMIMLGVWLAMLPITMVLFVSGIIEINFNYLDELRECEIELDALCSPCECKQSSWLPAVYILMGILLGFMIEWGFKNYQLNKTKEKKGKRK